MKRVTWEQTDEKVGEETVVTNFYLDGNIIDLSNIGDCHGPDAIAGAIEVAVQMERERIIKELDSTVYAPAQPDVPAVLGSLRGRILHPVIKSRPT